MLVYCTRFAAALPPPVYATVLLCPAGAVFFTPRSAALLLATLRYSTLRYPALLYSTTHFYPCTATTLPFLYSTLPKNR